MPSSTARRPSACTRSTPREWRGRGRRRAAPRRLQRWTWTRDRARRGGEQRAKLIFVTSPNNPDGSLAARRWTWSALLALPLVVVLDEAYVEFARRLERSRMRVVREHDNLIVLRTFSKWAGLAGLRVGYGVFPRG